MSASSEVGLLQVHTSNSMCKFSLTNGSLYVLLGFLNEVEFVVRTENSLQARFIKIEL